MNEAWRLDDHGELDDVVVPNVATFRLERMAVDQWWISLYYADGRVVHIDLCRKNFGILARRRDD